MQNFKYMPLERIEVPQPVRRIPFITVFCEDKVVLDLGALDETAYAKKINSEMWLHKKISEVATYVWGVDNSEIVPINGIATSENSIILKGNILNFDALPLSIQSAKIDLVVAGELIEHLKNPLEFLENLKKIPADKIILTTPNACNIHNFLMGLFNRESMHKDHINIFSIKSLNTLLQRAGFNRYMIVPYHVEFSEMILNSIGMKKQLARIVQKVVNFLERRFPVLSGGLVVVIDLP